jgi:hypothetical protein
MAMSTLQSIQEAALTLTDIRAHVAYMHWSVYLSPVLLYKQRLTGCIRTVLYHPLTPFFVLFCNIVATSDSHDFRVLKRVTEELEGLVSVSNSIAKLQSLFKSFLELCEGLVSEKRQNTGARNYDTNADHFGGQQTHDVTPGPSSGIVDELPSIIRGDSFSTNHSTPMPLANPDTMFTFSTDSVIGVLEPGWELFDVQPTLDWLDADFSFFDNEQYQQG